MRTIGYGLLSCLMLAVLPASVSDVAAVNRPSSTQRADLPAALPAPSPLRSIQDWNPDRSEAADDGDLALWWKPVPGAVSYVIQRCASEGCAELRDSSAQGSPRTDPNFRTVATVTSPRYVATELQGNTPYGFRVAGIDAEGRHGSFSPVLAGRTP